MAANVPDSKVPQPGSLQAMLARLRGMMQALKSTDTLGPERAELLPTWDAVAATSADPAASSPTAPADLAEDSGSCPQPAAGGTVPEGERSPAAAQADAVPAPLPPAAPAESQVPQLCPQCSSPRHTDQDYCDNCGWVFSTT